MKQVDNYEVLTDVCPLQIEGKIGNTYFHLRLRNYRLWVGFFSDSDLNECFWSYKWNVWTENTMDISKAIGIVEYTYALMDLMAGEEE